MAKKLRVPMNYVVACKYKVLNEQQNLMEFYWDVVGADLKPLKTITLTQAQAKNKVRELQPFGLQLIRKSY